MSEGTPAVRPDEGVGPDLLGAGGPAPRNAPGRAAWVGIVATAIAVVASLGGAVASPASRVAGSPTVDGFGTQWFYWFAGEVAAGRQQAGWTDLLFHPWGKDVYTHTGGNLLDAWLAWPLREALGPVLGFNAWIVIVLATNAWAGARLAAAFGVGAGARWPAAVALVLNPYVLGEIDLGRPTQAWLAPAGFAVAGLVEMRRIREGLVAGLWLAVAALGYWYYGLVLAVAAALVGLARLAGGPERVRVLAANAAAAGVAAGITLPFALPMLRALEGGHVPGLLAVDGTGPLAPLALRTVEGDEQGLYVVAPLRVAAGSLLDDGGLRFNPGIPALFGVHLLVAAVGCGLLLWGVAGRDGAPDTARRGALRGAPPRPKNKLSWIWLPLALGGALVVASGPAFVVGDALVPNRAWIALVAEVDALRRWWWPGRAVFLVHVLVAPLLAVVLAAVPWRRGARVLAGLGLLAVLLAPLRREALLPMATWDAAVPDTLACLAAAPPGAVIDVPLLVDQKNLWFQTVHRHPILGGMLLKKPAFAPAAFAAFRHEDPLVAALDLIGEKHYTRDVAPATEAQRMALVARGYRYVLARVDAFARPRTDARGQTTWVSEWSRPRRQLLSLLGPPAAEDAALAAWTLDGAPLCGDSGGD